MNKRKLGQTGPEVFPLALGGSGMSGSYGASDDNESIATIHAALDAGIDMIDTGDFYGMGHNEMLIGRAIKGREVKLSVKFGALRGPDGAFLGIDTRPSSVKTSLAYSLKRLGVDHVEIYRPARLDPSVPIEDTIGAIAEMVQAGYVRHIGLSEVGPETIQRAAAAHPIVDLQIEYSLITRGPEEKIFPVLEELGIGATPYGVLSHGLLSNSKPAATGDYRAHLPRFTGENLSTNQRLVERFQELARDKGVTPVQLAFAYVLAKGSAFIPLLGARTRAQLQEGLGALQIQLSPEDVEHLEREVPAEAVAGTRYDTRMMQMLDSEK